MMANIGVNVINRNDSRLICCYMSSTVFYTSSERKNMIVFCKLLAMLIVARYPIKRSRGNIK